MVVPGLHFLRIEAATGEDTDSNVDQLIVTDGCKQEDCVLVTAVDAIDEGFKTLTWLPVRCHTFLVGVTIFGSAVAIRGEEMVKYILKDCMLDKLARTYQGMCW